MQDQDKKNYNTPCMRWGLMAGVLWSISFILCMSPSMSIFSPLIGIYSVWYVGKQLREYRYCNPDISAMRIWVMSFYTFVYSTLITIAVQYIYLRWGDGGMLASQMQQVINTPEYQKMIFNGNEANKTEIESQLMELVSSAKNMTIMLLWYNLFLSLILSLPTTLIAILGKENKQ